MPEIRFFKTQADLRKWFEKNHIKDKELIVGFYKKTTGKKSITWPESVDEALCFGWIDSIRKRINDDSYSIRFTPRRKNSNWSNVNIRRINELIELGLVKEEGKKAFANRDETKSSTASYEQPEIILPAPFEKQFKINKKAWAYFKARSNSYKKAATWWVISAKQEITKQKRLSILISDSEKGCTLKHLTRP